jgi:glutamyl-tRNA synthetase
MDHDIVFGQDPRGAPRGGILPAHARLHTRPGDPLTPPRSRLAPSPTGALHLGNARTFLLNWLLVRSAGGSLAFRIEDLDGPRVRPGAAEQAIEDLAWLGLHADEAPLLQSTRAPAHAAALEALRAAGHLYPCICTRREIESARSAPQEGEDAPPYPGTCRGRFPDADAARSVGGREPAWRFRTTPGRVVQFVDGFRGPVSLEPARTHGDFVVARNSGEAAYMLAVVVDDAHQRVDLVVRGDDLVPSTPLQLLLHEALGLAPPAYVHLPLLRGPDGRRLAKRHGDTRLAAYRDAGVSAETVIGWLARWSSLGDGSPTTAQGLLEEGFDLGKVVKEDVVVNPGVLL